MLRKTNESLIICKIESIGTSNSSVIITAFKMLQRLKMSYLMNIKDSQSDFEDYLKIFNHL